MGNGLKDMPHVYNEKQCYRWMTWKHSLGIIEKIGYKIVCTKSNLINGYIHIKRQNQDIYRDCW